VDNNFPRCLRTGSILGISQKSVMAGSAALLALALSGCSLAPTQHGHDHDYSAEAVTQSPWAQASQPEGLAPLPWRNHHFPSKQVTHFQYQRLDGRDAVEAQADASASLLRQVLQVEPERLGTLKFSWKVPALITDADMTQRDADDSPVRVMLAFDGDRSKLSTRNAMMSELARALTGEDLPYATLVYVWSNKLPQDSTLHSPRSDRIRKIVLESGPEHLGQWRDYERDIRADYQRCFGEAPGRLIGVALMTDTDNTRAHSQAWYGPVHLQLKPAAKP
jgi:hypothetical protein